MTEIDQFESIFKSATRTPYTYERIEFNSVLVVTDRDEAGARQFGERIRATLKVIGPDARWEDLRGDAFQTVHELLQQVEQKRPDLICTYRNLHSGAWRWPYSLGSHLDVLTQYTRVPVMVFPHPESGRELDHALENTGTVMAFTDHLTGDHRLVHYAVRFTDPEGTLILAHVESERDFEHYVDVISKIPEIDTESARAQIRERLLKEPHDYIRSCRETLEAAKVPLKVEEIVTIARRLDSAKTMILDHKVDLLVIETKDEDQLAMHGLAHPLAVELREIPILML